VKTEMARFKNSNLLPSSVDLVLIPVLLVNEPYIINMVFILGLYGFEKKTAPSP
jgi:hypothetical protein